MKDVKEIISKLTALHKELEIKNDKNDTWRMARHLEDIIGSGQYLQTDIEKAEYLLAQKNL